MQQHENGVTPGYNLERLYHWLESRPRYMQALIFLASIAAFVWQITRPQDPHVVKSEWLLFFLFVAATAATILLRQNPQIEQQRPAGLGQFNFPTATEGRPVPILWGRVRIDAPNVVWYGDLTQDAIIQRQEGAFFSSSSAVVGYQYNVGVQFALCRGPVTLKRIWVGDTEIFNGTRSVDASRIDVDLPELFGGNNVGNGGIQSSIDFYTGSTTQPVNAYLDTAGRQRVTTAATPTAPRYSGTSYLVARELTEASATATDRGAYLGNSPSIKRWSFEVERFPGLFSGQVSGANIINNTDANPINVAYEAITNTEWGLGQSSSEVDIGVGSSFVAAATTMVTEDNGFSMLLDESRPAFEIIREIERQIDGTIRPDPVTGQWRVVLARNDYDIDTVPQITDDNVIDLRNFTRGTWEDTSNQVSLQYSKRDDDYKESYALAQDMANSLIIGDGTFAGNVVSSADRAYPGIKNSALAANIAWRDLRAASRPLARVQVEVHRAFYAVGLGEVVAWTNAARGITKLPMRVSRIEYGTAADEKITMDLVEDAFQFLDASFGTPPPSSWTPPELTLAAYPADEQLAMEAPRGLVVRDPMGAALDESVSRIFCAVRRQVGETGFIITQRNATGTPSGTYADDGTIVAFMRVGGLKTALSAGSAIPLTSLTLAATPDGQAALETAFVDGRTLADIGTNLVHLIMVNDEFMLVSSASNGAGTDVDLSNVYRGVLDSVQGNHAANDDVYLVFFGSGLNNSSFPNTQNVDIELRALSITGRFSGSVTGLSLTMAKRMLRPTTPAAVLYNGSATVFGTPDLEDNGSGENGQQFRVDWRRRRYDTFNEINELLTDTDPDVAPNASSTEFQVRVFVDPSGSNTEIASSPFAWTAGTGTIQVPRNEIIELAAAGTEIRVQIQTRHDIADETALTSRYSLIHDVTPTSSLTSLFYLGGNLQASTASNSYTAAAAGTHTVRIGAAYSTSNVQYRLNGGSWTTVISAGSTSGTIAGVAVSDTIEVRHTANETPDPQFVEIENPSTATVAYGTFSS